MAKATKGAVKRSAKKGKAAPKAKGGRKAARGRKASSSPSPRG